MIDLGRSVMAQLKHGTMTEQDLVHYLQDNYPVTQICQTCAELIMGSGMIEKPKIETVSKALGHSNLQTTTRHYAKLLTESVIKEISENIAV